MDVRESLENKICDDLNALCIFLDSIDHSITAEAARLSDRIKSNMKNHRYVPAGDALLELLALTMIKAIVWDGMDTRERLNQLTRMEKTEGGSLCQRTENSA